MTRERDVFDCGKRERGRQKDTGAFERGISEERKREGHYMVVVNDVSV